jgi:geranylgeranyl diphosphate synthase, type I
MMLEEFTRQLLPAVEGELQRIVNQFVPGSALPGELYKMIAYHLGWEGPGAGPEAQGKRIRPLLVLLSTGSSGSPWQKALPAAAAVELVHNFSLIHDDIQDKGELRRNRPTLWVKWGIPQAINAGDTMFTLAQLAILQQDETTSVQTALEAGKLLNQACIDLTLGQYLDLSYEGKHDLTLDDYWPMINGKTAALLSTCTELGALISGAPESACAAFRDYGKYLGLAFQVQDDFLGIWGDTEQIGKSTKTDLTTGKKTLPVLFSLGRNGKFAELWNDHAIASEDVPEAVELLTSDGAYEFTKETADHLTQLALQSLKAAVPNENEASLALTELTNSLLARNS